MPSFGTPRFRFSLPFVLYFAIAAFFVFAAVLTHCVSLSAKPQQAQRASVDWVFLIDTSRTMLGEGQAKGKNIFADVKQTIYDFLESQVQVNDSVQVISFDSQPVRQPTAFIAAPADKETIRRAVAELPAKGLYTYIALVIADARKIIEQRHDATQARGQGRRTCVVIFTDGINEPPPGASVEVDLRKALAGFPKTDAYFYFVNIGDESETNDLFHTMKSIPELRDRVLNHPGAADIEKVVVNIGSEVEAGQVDFFMKIVEMPLALEPGRVLILQPLEVSSTGPGFAKLQMIKATPGLKVEVDETLPLNVGKAFRPRLRITGDMSLNDQRATAELELAPAGNTHLRGPVPTISLDLRFHATTFSEKMRPWIFILVMAGVLSLAGYSLYRQWNTVYAEGLLYVQQPGKSQADEPVDLKRFRKTEVVIGGPGGDILGAKESFRFRLRAEGSGGSVRQMRILREEGTVTVNGLESLSQLCHEDEIAAGEHRIRYENPRLQRTDED